MAASMQLATPGCIHSPCCNLPRRKIYLHAITTHLLARSTPRRALGVATGNPIAASLPVACRCSSATSFLAARRRTAPSRNPRTIAAAAVQAYPTETQEKCASLAALNQWIREKFGVETGLEPKVFRTDGEGFRVGLVAAGDAQAGQALLQLPDKAAITATDAVEHPQVGPAAESCGGFELSAMALWLMAEKAAGEKSFWYPFLKTLPEFTMSPILWSESERQQLLDATSIGKEASEQAKALEGEWQRLHDNILAKDPQRYPPDIFIKQSYMRAFTVVAGHASFLPSAQCWALVPLVAQLGRTTSADAGVTLDFNLQTSLVQLTALGQHRSGQEVRFFEERPNGELLLATGDVIPSNPNDFILFTVSLIAADRYWQSKKAILAQMGMDTVQPFPVYKDKMPLQLFAYLRLARIQDPLLFAKASFEQDVKLSDMNEYEILQLLLGDCREKLFAFRGNSEDDVKLLQDSSLGPKARLATQLSLGEKEILVSAMDTLRRRLAPIRGIPVKGGAMEDPNKDILEVFEFIETLPQQPVKFFRNVFGLDEKQR